MRRMFDFQCEEGHTHEAFVDSEVRNKSCLECGKDAVRLVSGPQVQLEGITGAFPGAYYAWNRKRAEKYAQERKKNAGANEG